MKHICNHLKHTLWWTEVFEACLQSFQISWSCVKAFEALVCVAYCKFKLNHLKYICRHLKHFWSIFLIELKSLKHFCNHFNSFEVMLKHLNHKDMWLFCNFLQIFDCRICCFETLRPTFWTSILKFLKASLACLLLTM